jgi:hypothetical protein
MNQIGSNPLFRPPANLGSCGHDLRYYGFLKRSRVRNHEWRKYMFSCHFRVPIIVIKKARQARPVMTGRDWITHSQAKARYERAYRSTLRWREEISHKLYRARDCCDGRKFYEYEAVLRGDCLFG